MIAGKYYAHIRMGAREVTIPVIISDKAEDLYNACSPNHGFESSLTFEPGVPLEHDAHGAEATLAGYIKLGTHVAYIPENIEKEGRFSKPPWAARLFIHVGQDETDRVSYVPQPAYSIDRVLGQILMDAVDYILFNMSNTNKYASCTSAYEGVYVDLAVRRPILKQQLDGMDRYWGCTPFVRRVK